MRKKMFLGVALVGLLLCTSACGKKKNNSTNNGGNNPVVNPTTQVVTGPVANTNEGVVKSVDIDGLNISNISLIVENGHSAFTATLTNTNEAAVNVTSFNIIFRDANGTELVTLQSFIGQNLENNESALMRGNVEKDLLNATSVEYVKNF